MTSAETQPPFQIFDPLFLAREHHSRVIHLHLQLRQRKTRCHTNNHPSQPLHIRDLCFFHVGNRTHCQSTRTASETQIQKDSPLRQQPIETDRDTYQSDLANFNQHLYKPPRSSLMRIKMAAEGPTQIHSPPSPTTKRPKGSSSKSPHSPTPAHANQVS